MSVSAKMAGRLIQVAGGRETLAGSSEGFHAWRRSSLAGVESAAAAWNGAVGDVVSYMGRTFDSYTVRERGRPWIERIAGALAQMREPLRSDVILTTREPLLNNARLTAAVRAFNATILEQDLEFMPRTFTYPKFPYFQVEPATQRSLDSAGLYLLTNLPEFEQGGNEEPGAGIDRSSYLRVPMISVELDLLPLGGRREGAVLMNWSCRGRNSVHAKIFIDGVLDVPPFEVMSTSDDSTPNFWTVVPWREGKVIVDLQPVGRGGYLWFEHVDIHHISWDE